MIMTRKKEDSIESRTQIKVEYYKVVECCALIQKKTHSCLLKVSREEWIRKITRCFDVLKEKLTVQKSEQQ